MGYMGIEIISPEMRRNAQVMLLFHPILYLQAWNPFKVLDVACNENEVFLKSCGSYKHIHIAYTKTLFFEFPAYFSVFPGILNR